MKIRIFTITMMLLIMNACSGTGKISFPSDVKVPENEMNTAISLIDLPIMENSHKNNESLVLNIVNLTKKHIYFSSGYGIQIYKYTEEKWEAVQNNTYYPEESFYLPTDDEYPGGTLVSVMPTIFNMQEPTEIYVFLYGNLDSPDGKLVGAYFKYALLPNENFK